MTERDTPDPDITPYALAILPKRNNPFSLRFLHCLSLEVTKSLSNLQYVNKASA